MNDKDKLRNFERGGAVFLTLFLKPPGEKSIHSGPQYKDGFNVHCRIDGTHGEPRYKSRHLHPKEALELVSSLDSLIGLDVSSQRSGEEWVNDSYDLMPAALDSAISGAEQRVHELRQIRSALTGQY